jgi:predicted DNA-binding transcriptional regulator YafY
LELAGVPFWYDPDFGECGGYRIKESFFFPHVGLTDEECFDLAVVSQLAEHEGIPLVGELCHVRDKLLGTLPAKQQALIGEASALFEILGSRMTNQKRCRQTMLALQEALVAKRQIEASYQGPADRRSAKLKLQPLRVFLCDQTWHLAAHDNKEDRVKLFRLSGFQSVKVLDEAMTIPSTFSLRDYLGCAWSVQRGDRDYHVEIVFDAEAAPFIQERQWHRTQELEKQKDGSVIFRATVSGLDEIKHWVLGWGPKATVRKPKELAEEVQQLARQTLEAYRKK